MLIIKIQWISFNHSSSSLARWALCNFLILNLASYYYLLLLPFIKWQTNFVSALLRLWHDVSEEKTLLLPQTFLLPALLLFLETKLKALLPFLGLVAETPTDFLLHKPDEN